MTETYKVVTGSATLDSVDSKELASFLARDGQGNASDRDVAYHGSQKRRVASFGLHRS